MPGIPPIELVKAIFKSKNKLEEATCSLFFTITLTVMSIFTTIFLGLIYLFSSDPNIGVDGSIDIETKCILGLIASIGGIAISYMTIKDVDAKRKEWNRAKREDWVRQETKKTVYQANWDVVAYNDCVKTY